MKKIIQVENLRKSYGNVRAVQDAHFYVEEGQLFALLGENGAGKSTTIDILCTLLKADGGDVSIAGHRLGKQDEEIRRSIGVVFQNSYLDGALTVRENLTLRGSLYGLGRQALRQRISALAGPLGIEEFLDRRYGQLSGGQRRRADIARALINTPKVLFLDEPSTGLDPASRRDIWEMVRQTQRGAGTTVLLTTHYMEEAAGADYVIVMGHGHILAKGTPPDLKNQYTSDVLRIQPKNGERLLRMLQSDDTPFVQKSGTFCLPLPSTLHALPLLRRYEPEVKSFEVAQGNMDEAFLNIIKTGEEKEKPV